MWMSGEGMWYTLQDFSNKQYQVGLQSPKGSTLKFQLCSHPEPNLVCRNGKKSPTCLSVPGVSPSSTGMKPRIEQVEPNIPNMGIRLVYEDGDVCEVTNIPRKTIIKLPCSVGGRGSDDQLHAHHVYPLRAYEGERKEVCHYFVEFPPSKYGCPMDQNGETSSQHSNLPLSHTFNNLPLSSENEGQAKVEVYPPPAKPPPPPPEVSAVTGCRDSAPARTTKDCHFAGQIKLIIHGRNFHIAFCKSEEGPMTFITTKCTQSFVNDVAVFVGNVQCSSVVLISQYQINCTLVNGAGSDQDVVIKVKAPSLESGWAVKARLTGAVSFKERVNYRERFSKFVELGVGGLKKEIDELYRRAFASRGKGLTLAHSLKLEPIYYP